MRVFYITRTYEDEKSKIGGCSGIRNYHVELLRRRYKVVVVTPNYNSENDIVNDSLISLHYTPKYSDFILEAVGLKDDYLDDWVNRTLDRLSNIVTGEDVVYSTSGGELGCIKLGSLLKKRNHCGFIINFHDAVDATHMCGEKIYAKYHVCRDDISEKYVRNADYAITVSQTHAEETLKIYPTLNGRIECIYRGYRKCDLNYTKNDSERFRLVYAGTMNNRVQNIPEIISILSDIDGCSLELIGTPNKRIRKMIEKKDSNVKLTNGMKYDECMRYMKENADVGIVSIMADALAIAAPSKLFDIINLEIPILGIMPKGDGQNLINKGLGLAADYRQPERIRENVRKLMDKRFYEKTVSYIKKHKKEYEMENLFGRVYSIIDSIDQNGKE